MAIDNYLFSPSIALSILVDENMVVKKVVDIQKLPHYNWWRNQGVLKIDCNNSLRLLSENQLGSCHGS